MTSRIGVLPLVAAILTPGCAAAKTPVDDWRHGGVCYEVFVRSFQDSDGDGIGDLPGLIQRLDYVNDGDPASTDDLGARCIWLMPVTESPSYHGYDVTDYERVDADYGTNEDFRRLIEEAHRRGIHVLIDMVVNHTSDEHPWFRSALQGPASPYRDWYRWSDTPGPGNEFGGENWAKSPVRDEYYYGFFWRGMPDLNWETPAVREEMKRVAAFWLRDMGADGLRLDAVRHLMEAPDGRSANVPRTHDMLREYGEYIRAIEPESFTIGEVFDSTDVLVSYYPDQLDAYFAFEVANAILGAVRSGSSRHFLEAVTHAQDVLPAGRWAPFLRNHDQTRTMTWLGDDVARAKLAAGLLLTLPGIPFVYYGEEIGMTGDKPDERIRTPMQWNRTHAAGFTTGQPWEPLAADSPTASVESLEEDPGSILNLYRRLIHLRSGSRALGTGELIPLDAGTDAVAAYLRRDGDDAVLVVANLSESGLADVLLSSGGAVLAPGRYSPRSLFGGSDAAPLAIDADGRMRDYTPLGAIAPMSLHIFQVTGR